LFQIFSSASCSQTPSVYILLLLSHPYRTTGNIIALYILTLKFLTTGKSTKGSGPSTLALPEFSLILIFSWIKFWYVTLVPIFHIQSNLCQQVCDFQLLWKYWVLIKMKSSSYNSRGGP
jgi:hypothetical protein